MTAIRATPTLAQLRSDQIRHTSPARLAEYGDVIEAIRPIDPAWAALLDEHIAILKRVNAHLAKEGA